MLVFQPKIESSFSFLHLCDVYNVLYVHTCNRTSAHTGTVCMYSMYNKRIPIVGHIIIHTNVTFVCM
jgi:hypothetical protein